MKEINTYDELRDWKSERQYITGICGNDTINFSDKLWTMELYKKKNGSDLSAIFKLNDESWFVHDFKLPEHDKSQTDLLKICISNDFEVDYDRSRGMYRVTAFDNDHYKTEYWFDAFEEKEWIEKNIETWKIRIDNDGFEHHCCPKCNKDAIFHYITEESWDEDCDGNWQSCGEYISDIYENLTPYCPYCGSKLIEETENDRKR